MSTILKADIFFVISSLGVIVVSIAIAIAAYYVVKAAKEARALIASARDEFETLRDERRALTRHLRIAIKWWQRVGGDRFARRKQ